MNKRPHIEEQSILSKSNLEFCNNIVGEACLVNENTFLEEYEDMDGMKLHSTLISQDAEESLPLGQGSLPNVESSQALFLQAKLFELEAEVKRKDTVINELQNELAIKKGEVTDAHEELTALKKEKDDLTESQDHQAKGDGRS